MATRAYWKGYLKLSLVTCPVALYPASSQSEKLHFHQINRKNGNRLRQQMVDERTGKVVDKDEKGRGYELAKGKYVEIEPQELDAVEVEATHTIDIDKFVPAKEIDRRYYDKPYYIAPNGKSGVEAFAVICDAMKEKDKVALARIVMANREHIIALEPFDKGLLGTTLRYVEAFAVICDAMKEKDKVALARIVMANREHIIALEPFDKGLLGTTLRYDYEVRGARPYLGNIPKPRVDKEMVERAGHILDSKAGHFDQYEAALKKLVKRKAAGKTIEAPEPVEDRSNVIDLMDALKQSMKSRAKSASRKHRAKPHRKTRRAS